MYLNLEAAMFKLNIFKKTNTYMTGKSVTKSSVNESVLSVSTSTVHSMHTENN